MARWIVVFACKLCLIAALTSSISSETFAAQEYAGRTCGANDDTSASDNVGRGVVSFPGFATVTISATTNCNANRLNWAGSSPNTVAGFVNAGDIGFASFLNSSVMSCSHPGHFATSYTCGAILMFGSNLTVTDAGGLSTTPVFGGRTEVFSDNLSSTNASATITFSDGVDSYTLPFSTSGTQINGLTISLAAPEINLTGDGVNIADDPAHVPSFIDHTTFEAAAVAGGTNARTFTIENTGTADLNLTNGMPLVVIGGTDAADFTVTAGPTTPITAGNDTMFTITFDPSAAGVRTATVEIANNDADENPYNFNIQGTGFEGPAFSKAFTPDTITAGGISTLTFTIDNSANTFTAKSLDFTDNLPAGVLIAATPNAATTCNNGTLTATAGTGIITYTNLGDVAAGATCTVSVDVTSAVIGTHLNTSGALTSSLGNSGAAKATLTVGTAGATVEETQKVITEFMSNRANHILGNQPNLINFVDGTNTTGGGELGFLGINGNEDGQTLAFSTSRSKILASMEANRLKAINHQTDEAHDELAQSRIISAFAPEDEASSNLESIDGMSGVVQTATLDTNSDQSTNYGLQNNEGEEVGASGYGQANDSLGRAGTWDIWTEIYGSRTTAGTSNSSLWVGYLGFHTFVTDHMLVGVLGQLDWAEETNSTLNSNADGSGLMVGPYIAGKVPNQNVYYEARASWGRSSNEVSPIGTYTDSFDTTRWLASAKLSGSHKVGDITIRPEARISWFEETQESYTDSIAQTIPEQTISLGEVRFGPTISRSITLDDGIQVQPSIGISGVWNFGINDNVASQGFALGNDDLRARFDGGLSTTNSLGWILALTGFYDGIGINDYDSYGGSIRLTVPLN